MKTRLAPIALLALTGLAVACSTNDSAASESSSTTASVAAQSVNKRGAQEVTLGQPVTIAGKDGKLIVKITGTRLEQSGCDTSLSPEVVQSKFAATIETGDVEQPEWLWASDMYYVDSNGKVAQNVDVVQTSDAVNPCSGSTQFIDVPKNSTADGSPTLVVPRITQAIGYKLDADGTTYRVEWKLPNGWAPAPAASTAPAADTTEAPTEEPAPTETQSEGSGIPPEWDKNGDGLIDADAPVGDVGCDTSECLVEKNRQGAESAP